uniref:Uncharacterized protein n=1 Tax=Brassica campestris TaxID=3711 RepID=M4FDS3_BRACM
MGYQDKEKKMENPDVVHKVCDGPWLHQTERTVHATAPRLYSVPNSHPALLICFNSFLFSSLWLNTKGPRPDQVKKSVGPSSRNSWAGQTYILSGTKDGSGQAKEP